MDSKNQRADVHFLQKKTLNGDHFSEELGLLKHTLNTALETEYKCGC